MVEAHFDEVGKTMEYIPYYRVSTRWQEKSGLGLEAQQEAVRLYLARQPQCRLSTESFQDIESGRHNDRPGLEKAIRLTKARKATLLIAKLDRLSRNVAFTSALMESRVRFVACDFPEADSLVLHILSAVAEDEVKRIRTRIREALAAKKRRGEPVGKSGPALYAMQLNGAKASARARQGRRKQRDQKLATTVGALRQSGMTLEAVGRELKNLGYHAPRGGQWHPTSVSRILTKAADTEEKKP